MSLLLICVVLSLWPLAAEGLQWSLQEPRVVFLWEADLPSQHGRTRYIWIGSSDIFFGRPFSILWQETYLMNRFSISWFARWLIDLLDNSWYFLLLAFGKRTIVRSERAINLSDTVFPPPSGVKSGDAGMSPALHFCSCSCFTRPSESRQWLWKQRQSFYYTLPLWSQFNLNKGEKRSCLGDEYAEIESLTLKLTQVMKDGCVLCLGVPAIRNITTSVSGHCYTRHWCADMIVGTENNSNNVKDIFYDINTK